MLPALTAWLRSHGPIRLGYDQAFYPISYTNKRHQAEGYSIQLFRLLRDKVGLAVDEVAGPWSSVLKQVSDGELDVLVAVAGSPERREKLNFVGPYLSTPTAIVTRSNYQQVWDLAGFSGRKLALIEDHFLINRIRSAYPSIKLVEVPSQEDALRLLAAGSADVAIGNLHAVNRLIQSRFLGQLYIAGDVPDGDSELYFGVSKRAPELAAILRRALDSISADEVSATRNRWLDTQYAHGVPVTEITTFFGPLFAVLVTLLVLTAYWTRRMKAELASRKLAEERLAAETRALRAANADLEAFADTASQTLRAPLQDLGSNTELLAAAVEAGDPDTTRRSLEHIRNAGTKLREILDDLQGPPRQGGPV